MGGERETRREGVRASMLDPFVIPSFQSHDHLRMQSNVLTLYE